MNGEVTQASRIVAAARKSMKDGSAYEFTPLPYEGSVVFNFCDRNKSGAPLFRAKDPADWYAHLSKEGVKNIFMIMGMKVNRQALGFSNNSAVSIFVRYNDNVVTRFVPHWSFNDDARLWSVEYTEAVAENAPATDPDFRNEKSLTLATLSDIGELAQQLGQEQFVKTFKKAADILLCHCMVAAAFSYIDVFRILIGKTKNPFIRQIIPDNNIRFFKTAFPFQCKKFGVARTCSD